MQLAKWLGAADVRDAYPAWPWPHEHPGVGLPGFDSAPRQSGLLAIAAKYGIDHGCYSGTDIPYVATIDVLTTWHTESCGYRLIALENKPFDVVHDPNPLLRSKERLELVRRYCIEAQVPHVIVHAERLPREFSANVDMLQPLLAPKSLADLLSSRTYSQVVASLQDKGYEKSPDEILDDLRDRQGHSDAVLTNAFYLALWRQDVDHDLRVPFRPWEPLIPGGLAFKKSLMKAWGVMA
ncbi:UNVERIFIED_ORG: TnsA endonuclease N-terminal domain-containing protein [Shinella sp. XGS7]|nr:TnsA endonuclease N-terminal domain-containing protein [Shinella sp. XGS7]